VLIEEDVIFLGILSTIDLFCLFKYNIFCVFLNFIFTKLSFAFEVFQLSGTKLDCIFESIRQSNINIGEFETVSPVFSFVKVTLYPDTILVLFGRVCSIGVNFSFHSLWNSPYSLTCFVSINTSVWFIPKK
jgi:hypothetical protein